MMCLCENQFFLLYVMNTAIFGSGSEHEIPEYIVHGSKNGLLYDLTLNSYFGANICRWVRRFGPSAMGLVHILVSKNI